MESVFGTAELLEQILLDVDISTLLTSAQRINKQWFGVISYSPKLQEKLYFKPAKSIPTNFRLHDGAPRDKDPRCQHLTEYFGKIFLTSYSPYSWMESKDFFSMYWQSFTWSEHEEIGKTQVKDRFLHKDASWRRMLVFQPPPRQLKITVKELGKKEQNLRDAFINTALYAPALPPSAAILPHLPASEVSDSEAIYQPRITMGQLYDLFQQATGQHQRAKYFKVECHYDDVDLGDKAWIFLHSRALVMRGRQAKR